MVSCSHLQSFTFWFHNMTSFGLKVRKFCWYTAFWPVFFCVLVVSFISFIFDSISKYVFEPPMKFIYERIFWIVLCEQELRDIKYYGWMTEQETEQIGNKIADLIKQDLGEKEISTLGNRIAAIIKENTPADNNNA